MIHAMYMYIICYEISTMDHKHRLVSPRPSSQLLPELEYQVEIR